MVASLAATIVAATTGALAGSTPSCINLNIPLSVAATVRQFPSNFNPNTFNYSTVPDLPSTSISGNYDIAASYCIPGTPVPSRASTLQILVSGITYTRTYWSGLKVPPASINGTEYSWVDFASDQGYTTLAIDRLCTGDSSHPNGTLACQNENQAAILKAVVDDAKSGKLVPGTHFSNVILVGHSFGSIVLQAFIRKYPTAVQQIIFTGFSPHISGRLPPISQNGTFFFANQVDPVRFGTLDDSYLVINDENAFIETFFFGEFNESLAKHNFHIANTVNVFEVATNAFGQMPATNYTGKVIVLNGKDDGAVCAGNCGEGSTSFTEQVANLVPNASAFLAFNTLNTGHCINLHFTANGSYQVIFNGLSQHGN